MDQIFRELLRANLDLPTLAKRTMELVKDIKTPEEAQKVISIALENIAEGKSLAPRAIIGVLAPKWPEVFTQTRFRDTRPVQSIRVLTVIVDTKKNKLKLPYSSYEPEIATLREQASVLLKPFANMVDRNENKRWELLEPVVYMFNSLPETMLDVEPTLMILIRYMMWIPSQPPSPADHIIKLFQRECHSSDLQAKLANVVLQRLLDGYPCSVVVSRFLPLIKTEKVQENVARAVGMPDDGSRYSIALEKLLEWLCQPLGQGMGVFVQNVLIGLEQGRRGRDVVIASKKFMPTLLKFLVDAKRHVDGLLVTSTLFTHHLPQLIDVFKSSETQQLLPQFVEKKEELIPLMRLLYCYTLAWPNSVETPPIKRFLEDVNFEVDVEAQKKVWTESIKMETIQQTSQPLSIVPAKRVHSRVGLSNLGNTCFMNSMLQSLFTVKAFTSTLVETSSDNATVSALAKLFALMYGSNSASISPKAFLNTCPAWLRSGRQHDSGEFLKYLLDQLEPFPRLLKCFKGKVKTIVNCSQCHHESVRQEDMYDLVLPFAQKDGEPPLKRLKTNVTLESMLEDVFEPETLTGDNSYECETCKANTVATKQTCLVEAPDYLILVLGRFSYDVTSGTKSKIATPVDFPVELMVDQQGIQLPYRLNSVIFHTGSSSEYGHYYQFSADGEGWIECNDETIVPTISTTRMQTIRGNDTPYVFFYRRDDLPKESIVLSPALEEYVKANQTTTIKKATGFLKNDTFNPFSGPSWGM